MKETKHFLQQQNISYKKKHMVTSPQCSLKHRQNYPCPTLKPLHTRANIMIDSRLWGCDIVAVVLRTNIVIPYQPYCKCQQMRYSKCGMQIHELMPLLIIINCLLLSICVQANWLFSLGSCEVKPIWRVSLNITIDIYIYILYIVYCIKLNDCIIGLEQAF